MKILSDFDGVMTEQTAEALHQRRLFCDELARVAGLGAAAVEALLARAEAELEARPAAHGWWSGERLAAYADEDLFVRLIGAAACLDAWAAAGDPAVRAARQGLVAGGYATFVELSSWSYARMVEHTQQGGIAPLDPVVGEVLGSLLRAGHEVVVVSNSSTERVIDILRSARGLPHAAEDHAKKPGAPLRVRGGARKFELGEPAQILHVAGLRFDVTRPRYRDILEAEEPGAVIGDVFSLDLALPLHLAVTQPRRFGGARLLLRTRDYTPRWARELFGSGLAAAHLARLDAFAELPERLGL